MLLSQAQLVSQFGNQAFTIALTFWTAATTQSATMTGLMLMARVLPVIVLGPLTGTFADRLGSRLRIVVTCDLVSGTIVMLLALGFLAGPAAWRPAMLFTAALLIGVCNAFFDPAVNALTPDLVPPGQIEGANAFRQSSRQITGLTAQGLGGMLFALVGPVGLFLLDGLSFLIAGATEMLVQPPPRASPQSAIGNPQSAIRSPQSIRNPQSEIRNLQRCGRRVSLRGRAARHDRLSDRLCRVQRAADAHHGPASGLCDDVSGCGRALVRLPAGGDQRRRTHRVHAGRHDAIERAVAANAC